MKKSMFRIIFFIALSFILILSNPFVANQLISSLEDRHPYRKLENLPAIDVIVVLGGMVNPLTGHNDFPEFEGNVDRILIGEEALRRGKARYLLISGGSGLLLQRGKSEATILKQWLIGREIPEKLIIIEPSSRNTAENAIETAKIARGRDWKKILLITSAFHMPRSVYCFKKSGLDVIPFPVDYRSFQESPGPEAFVPAISSLSISTIAIKEYVGILAYWFYGYI